MLIMRLIGKGGTNMPRGFPNPIGYFGSLRASNTDVIIVRDIGRWFSLLGAISARILNIRIIIYSQTPLYKKYSFTRRLAMSVIMKILDAIWITPILGDQVDAKNLPKKIFYVPFAVEIREQERKKESSKVKILTIGKFVKRKNQLLLLNAINELSNYHEKFHLTIVGEVSNHEHRKNLNICKKFINDNNLNRRVKIVKNIPYHKIHNYYLSSDLFVLPATDEPAAISPLEALGSGIPVICSNKNGTKNYIKHKKSGVIFRDCSIESLKSSILYSIEESNLSRMKNHIKNINYKIISMDNFYDIFVRILARKQ